MFDETPDTAKLQRVSGRAAVGFDHAGGRTRLVRLAQAGAAKAMLPRVHDAVPEVVFLNTAGGLTGGDRLSYDVKLGPGARVMATTQTAERAYRAAAGVAEVAVRAEVAPGARLDWLPQETILFDGASLERRTEIALAGDAACLMVETLVLGRAAMGETVARLGLADRRRVTRDGVPVLIEPVALDDAALARAGGAAMLGGARAWASLAFLAPGAEAAADALRALPEAPGVRWAASGWDGKCVFRALASDARPVRRVLARAVETLAGRLPRVWNM